MAGPKMAGPRMARPLSADPPSDSTAPLQEQRQERFEELRERIIAVDDEIIKLIGERRDLALEIGRSSHISRSPSLDQVLRAGSATTHAAIPLSRAQEGAFP